MCGQRRWLPRYVCRLEPLDPWTTESPQSKSHLEISSDSRLHSPPRAFLSVDLNWFVAQSSDHNAGNETAFLYCGYFLRVSEDWRILKMNVHNICICRVVPPYVSEGAGWGLLIGETLFRNRSRCNDLELEVLRCYFVEVAVFECQVVLGEWLLLRLVKMDSDWTEPVVLRVAFCKIEAEQDVQGGRDAPGVCVAAVRAAMVLSDYSSRLPRVLTDACVWHAGLAARRWAAARRLQGCARAATTPAMQRASASRASRASRPRRTRSSGSCATHLPTNKHTLKR